MKNLRFNHSKRNPITWFLQLKNNFKLFIIIIVAFVLFFIFVNHKKPVQQTTPNDFKRTEIFSVVVNKFSVDKNKLYILDFSGKLVANRHVTLISKNQGEVKKIFLKEGSINKKGTTVLEIEDLGQKSSLAQVNANVEAQNNNYSLIYDLYKKGLASKQELLNASIAKENAKSSLKVTKDNYNHLRPSFPFMGLIDKVLVDEGESINIGTPLAEIYDINPYFIETSVSEQNLKLLSIGDLASVELRNGLILKGILDSLSPVGNQNTNTYAMKIKIDNNDNKIYPINMSAKVSLEINRQKQQLIEIPLSIILIDNMGKPFIKQVNDNNEVFYSQIKIIEINDENVLVTGINTNYPVIIVGFGFVKNGEKVDIKNTEGN